LISSVVILGTLTPSVCTKVFQNQKRIISYG